MEYWESKADEGLILYTDSGHPYRIDLIPPNPIFPGPDRIHRKSAINLTGLINAQIATIHTIVAPGRANTPVFHHSRAFVHGIANFL